MQGLCKDRAAGSALGKFALGRGERGLDELALAVALGRESISHLRSHAVDLPADMAAFRRKDAISAQLLANEGMVAFTVELGIGQNQGDGGEFVGLRHQLRQTRTIIGRSAVSGLGEDDLAFEIDNDQPFEPVPQGKACGRSQCCVRWAK